MLVPKTRLIRPVGRLIEIVAAHIYCHFSLLQMGLPDEVGGPEFLLFPDDRT